MADIESCLEGYLTILRESLKNDVLPPFDVRRTIEEPDDECVGNHIQYTCDEGSTWMTVDTYAGIISATGPDGEIASRRLSLSECEQLDDLLMDDCDEDFDDCES